MSYSRWTNSFWYTYWKVGESKNKMEQEFVANGCVFTYKEIKKNKIKCARLALENEEVEDSMPEKQQAKIQNELVLYMDSFLKDVENDKWLV